MPPLTPLSTSQEADFTARLARYGLTPPTVQPLLSVPDGQTLHLNRTSRQSGPRAIELTNVERLRQVIGLPDSVASQAFPRFPQMVADWRPVDPTLARYAAARSAAESRRDDRPAAEINFKKLDRRDLGVIQGIGHAALAGHPEAARFTPLLDAYLKAIRFQISLWAYTDLHLGRESRLILGDVFNVVVAGRVVIEAGGQLIAYGNLKVDCVILQEN